VKIHALLHAPFEGLGSIEGWAAERGIPIGRTRLWLGEPFPAPGAVDWLVVMGGPMSVHDEAAHPWLKAEKRFLRDALDAGARAVGICLGAQLLAQSLGARVFRARAKEIGWFPVALTPEGRRLPPLAAVPERWEVFHWHGETFDLPPGAVRLAGSDVCENQAFLHGRSVLAFQFHPEVARASAEALIQHLGHEIEDIPTVQPPSVMLGDEPRFVKAREWMRGILNALTAAWESADGRPAGRSR
jgi:GMP synthase-like glutamine amidotransferase